MPVAIAHMRVCQQITAYMIAAPQVIKSLVVQIPEFDDLSPLLKAIDTCHQGFENTLKTLRLCPLKVLISLPVATSRKLDGVVSLPEAIVLPSEWKLRYWPDCYAVKCWFLCLSPHPGRSCHHYQKQSLLPSGWKLRSRPYYYALWKWWFACLSPHPKFDGLVCHYQKQSSCHRGWKLR